MASLGQTPKQYAKTNIKIPQVCRWRMAGIKDTKIAELLNMTQSGLAQILASQEYKDYEESYLQGHLSKMDEALAGKISEIRKNFQPLVPAAMRALVDAVTQRKDLKASLEAAKEILDRDPDRTLNKNKESQQAETIPEEVLNQAVTAGNEIAKNYDDKTPVN
jgi:DNA-binding transcriptional MerR regulator